MNSRDSQPLNDTSGNDIGQLQQEVMTSKNSLNALADEHNKLAAALSQKEAELARIKQSLDTESRHRIEQAVACEQLKAEISMKCEQLAVKEASLYKRHMELQTDSSRTESTIGQISLRNIPKIPSFDDHPISFNHAEPDGNIDIWDNLRQSLSKQFGGTESLSMALDKVYSMRLTDKSDFNSFIQQVLPAIKIVTSDNSKLAIVILRKQIDTSIRKYLPEIANETFEQFEQRLKSQAN
ncbi:hypothetical protein AYI68_g6940 [Smittium mucronatum]|uniref:Uncharacterized protein n=1 Tax=Smittium mucronatum TaxID=133383 RepID=A0A1R0GQ34_9FUNG|nr:hypothetical protein AYI68_g6940 [Smittium mucronatum]